ncbi:hypothetical protein LV164_001539 [Aspergillus fumigatus]|nr:hypothetical protein KXX42_002516 [Aspergillus fumigatus]KAH1552257.1 hypothetical protein KXX57_007922 [Aspergillus fumigatus]KAH1977241.1 hypothetical protein KXW88_008534 [Aspergillus fumigatus]KAH2305851.1 hypothetical protein KXV47_008207 [Aspergillus fumigatus]KAH2669441.1 hypothetical protein KXV32_004188 [Aspergillus fumigatus]
MSSLKVGKVTGDGGRATGYQAARLGPAVRNAGDDKGGASGGNGSEIEFATKGTYGKVEAGDISSKGGDADVKGSRSWSWGRNHGIAQSGQATAGSGGKITIG